MSLQEDMADLQMHWGYVYTIGAYRICVCLNPTIWRVVSRYRLSGKRFVSFEEAK